MTMREYATPRFFQAVYLIRGRLPVPSASCPVMRQVSVNTKTRNLASQLLHYDSPRSESKMLSSKSRALSIIHLFCSRLVSGRYEAYSMSLRQMRNLSVDVKKGSRASFLAVQYSLRRVVDNSSPVILRDRPLPGLIRVLPERRHCWQLPLLRLQGRARPV